MRVVPVSSRLPVVKINHEHQLVADRSAVTSAGEQLARVVFWRWTVMGTVGVDRATHAGNLGIIYQIGRMKEPPRSAGLVQV